MKTGLQGKVAVVTGGAAGIGLACATRLAELGVAVGIGDIDGGAAQAAAASAAKDQAPPLSPCLHQGATVILHNVCLRTGEDGGGASRAG